ncbi:PglL family O-oligosaccharyltransferase [Rhodoferax sp.]|uniref:PglL family O-oligosaccharyltransferase n=1 Tax=Rhodoferax sp. TaxID=50421 RepID=UPI0027300AF7|nr:O-antigen ligase family protein [Rhodoferax sp.]MDP1529950.1 Wzy polymerase domain-containing protein [Rhodoferax sp.]MDP1942723.1 Wzy polymerase domain-containing protein [Rhodoferax sp.]MDP2443462.1 Wzy polymerase domain-containing protein [Rhodoferax sp.]MDZ4206289.1 Wzy polymerase domain-containing protein [Rhodoferax sp.]
MAPFWLAVWAGTLALGWLLPNHYRPWIAFHSDAWIASVLLVAFVALIWRSRGAMALHRITLGVALLIGIPWLQYGLGLIPQPGVAWISSAYLLGLFLALLLGARWEANSPGQLGDALFLAIGIAAVVLVGLQLQQWLQVDGLELWRLSGGPDRPSANLGQPNQLATLLLWGVLAAAWGLSRGRISGGVAILLVAYLLFGIALTGSRTAWIGVALLVVASWWWRSLWRSARLPWVTTGLGVYFVLCVVVQGWWHALDGEVPADLVRMSSELRPLAWAVFLDAAWQRPWFGYGWNQTALAQLAVATAHPPLHNVFSYAHNLFLDLILWCGIPLGLLVFASLVGWIWRCFRAVQSAENAVLLLLLFVVGNHAMLEMPLHYAYFLLPAGLVMGMLNTRFRARPVLYVARWAAGLLWLAATVLLALIIRDYSRVEPSYENLSFEWQRIKVARIGPPEVLLLTQWHDFVEFARYEPKAGLSQAELDALRSIPELFSGALFLHKYASILALNQRSDEARLWLQRLCKVASESECSAAKAIWAKQSHKYPEIAAIPWPVKTTD